MKPKNVWNKGARRMLERFELPKKLNSLGIAFDHFSRYSKVRTTLWRVSAGLTHSHIFQPLVRFSTGIEHT